MKKIIFYLFILFFFSITISNVASETGLSFPSNRFYYLRGEEIDVNLSLKGEGNVGLKVILEGEKFKEEKKLSLELKNNITQSINFIIMSEYLKPGSYLLKVETDSQNISLEKSFIKFGLIEDFPLTHFSIFACPSPEKEFKRQLIELRKLGISYLMVGVDGKDSSLNDLLLAYGFKYLLFPGIVDWGLSHGFILPGPYGWTAWVKPEIRKFASQLVQYYAQLNRKYPIFIGENVQDEPVAGLDVNDPINIDGIKNFLTPEETKDPEKFFLGVHRYHSLIMGNTWNYLKPYLKEINPSYIFTAQIHHPLGVSDGQYPPLNCFPLDIISTHYYRDWGQPQFFGADIARAGMWEKPLWLMVGYGGLRPEDWRAQVYLTLSGGVTGLGYFMHDLYIPTPWLKDSINEIKKINNEVLIPYGDLFLNLKKKRGPLGILYSISNAYFYKDLPKSKLTDAFFPYFDATSVIFGTNGPQEYTAQFLAGYLACWRAHYQPSILVEEDILDNALTIFPYKVLLLIDLHYLPKEVKEKIETFQKKGGIVLLDSRSSITIPGSQRIDLNFYDYFLYIKKILQLYSIGQNKEASILERVPNIYSPIEKITPRLKQELNKYLPLEFDTDIQTVYIAEQISGNGRYLFITNDYQVPIDKYINSTSPEDPYYRYFGTSSIQATLSFRPKEKYFIYDLFTQKEVSLSEAGQLSLSLLPGEGKIFVLLPEKISDLSIKLDKEKVEQGQNLRIFLTISDIKGKHFDMSIPVEIKVWDSQGRLRWHSFRATRDKETLIENLYFACNENVGNYKIEIKELVSGKTILKEFEVVEKVAPSVLKLLPNTIVFDKKAIEKFLNTKNEIWIVIGNNITPEKKRIIEELVEFLNKKGKKVELKIAKNIRKEDKIEGEFLLPNTHPRLSPLNIDIKADLILIGDPEDNILIRDIQQGGLLYRSLKPYYPGLGNAIIQYCWAPFEPGFDAIVLGVSDVSGLKVGLEKIIDFLK